MLKACSICGKIFECRLHGERNSSAKTCSVECGEFLKRLTRQKINRRVRDRKRRAQDGS